MVFGLPSGGLHGSALVMTVSLEDAAHEFAAHEAGT